MTTELENYRKELDDVDEQIVGLLSRRFSVCRSIGRHKAAAGIPMMQPDRIRFVKERLEGLAAKHNVNRDLLMSLYDLIIREACRLEDEVIAEAKEMLAKD